MKILRIISIILILGSVIMGVRHGWNAFQPADPEQAKMMADLGIGNTGVLIFGIVSIVGALMLLFPQTFLIGNIVNAVSIVVIMALALNAGNIRMALIEIPFLAVPLLLIWLKYPIDIKLIN